MPTTTTTTTTTLSIDLDSRDKVGAIKDNLHYFYSGKDSNLGRYSNLGKVDEEVELISATFAFIDSHE